LTSPSRDILVLIGTRPEAIKMAPVIVALKAEGLRPSVLLTGQHRELLLPIVAELKIVPDANLDVMEADQSLAGLSAKVLLGVRDTLRARRPAMVLVQGDTTTVAMGALASFYEGVPVGHVEAGLRTGHRRNPFPEEMNRCLVGQIADLHFAPTAAARENLLREGVDASAVHLVGNTVVDALFHARDALVAGLPPDPLLASMEARGRRLVLVTGHRRESFGADFDQICAGLRDVAQAFPDIDVVYPVHPNPNVQAIVHEHLSNVQNLHLVAPMSYVSFVRMLLHATLVVTDSGGVQEEAACLGVPVLVTRRTCERFEAVEAGVSELVGPDRRAIFESARVLLTDAEEHRRRARSSNVFGDGHAARRIAAIIASRIQNVGDPSR
jgi:UDP-N-acetylglucosamine 2-epimerase (non-hydrolysing)